MRITSLYSESTHTPRDFAAVAALVAVPCIKDFLFFLPFSLPRHCARSPSLLSVDLDKEHGRRLGVE